MVSTSNLQSQNVRIVNAKGTLFLIRYKPGKLNEMYGPYEGYLRFVTAFRVCMDRNSKLWTESVRVYWTRVQ